MSYIKRYYCAMSCVRGLLLWRKLNIDEIRKNCVVLKGFKHFKNWNRVIIKPQYDSRYNLSIGTVMNGNEGHSSLCLSFQDYHVRYRPFERSYHQAKYRAIKAIWLNLTGYTPSWKTTLDRNIISLDIAVFSPVTLSDLYNSLSLNLTFLGLVSLKLQHSTRMQL